MDRDIINIIIWAVVAMVILGLLWKNGQLARFRNYVALTRMELKKCSWPTKEELKLSTAVVFVSTIILAVFTIVVDFVINSGVTTLLGLFD